MKARMSKTFEAYDAIRIDHPQGLICPWVYRWLHREDQANAHRAVQQGARLFSSPDLAAHPDLATHAIATPQQLNRSAQTTRHADDWVQSLSAEQVERYGRVFDVIVQCAQERGRDTSSVVCEVLNVNGGSVLCG